jgi:hypothetical protein
VIVPLQAEEPLSFTGWTLTQNDMDYNLSIIDRMSDFGVTHVQLSHRIVTRIDQFEDQEIVDRVKVLSNKIHEQGGKSIVWAQELSEDAQYFFCYDLEGSDMAARMQAYRDALTKLPEIDGVMISFGSAPTEPYTTVPSCGLSEILPKERYKAIIEAVSRVVMDEFGKQVYVRTFYHSGFEIPFMRSALKETDRPIIAMSKSEPNDFEPYYPLNSLVGDIGDHPQFLELDCAGEYWGRGAIPFVAIEYFAQRFRESRSASENGTSTFIGSTCRVDRYEYSAMGTLNEANLWAQSKLVENPEVDWQDLLSSFITYRYGLVMNTESHNLLFDIMRRTYWIGRKMYYAKGEWAFKKGSELPSSNYDALSLQTDKTISQWDPAYLGITASVMAPLKQTVLELLQEKREAMELAQRNETLLPSLKDSLNVEDYNQLQTLLHKQSVATEIWFNMAGSIFAQRNLSISSSNWQDWHLDELERIADDLDSKTSPLLVDPYPFSSSDIRAFVDSSRSIQWFGSAEEPAWLNIGGIDIVYTDQGSAEITWDAKAGVRYEVELTTELPSYSTSYMYDADILEDKQVSLKIDNLEKHTPYWFRISAKQGWDSMVSGDYTFWTRLTINTEEGVEDNIDDSLGDHEDQTTEDEAVNNDSEAGPSFSISGGGSLDWKLLVILLLGYVLVHSRRERIKTFR